MRIDTQSFGYAPVHLYTLVYGYFSNIRAVCLRLNSLHLYLGTQLFPKNEGSRVSRISYRHLPIYMAKISGLEFYL